MKALLCKEFGPPESLVLEEIESPAPGPEEVLVRVHACGVNFPDLLLINNEYQFKPPLPFSPGIEVAGEVAVVGDAVDDLGVGDRVIGMPGWNGYREETIVDAARCIRMPDSMDFVSGAAFGTTYGTSYHGLVDRGDLQSGETLLVHGASGGVGTAAIEIGKILGARIIATGGSDAKLARLKEVYGIQHVVNIDGEEPFKQRVKALTDGRGADVIYDPVGGSIFEQSLRCINWGGRILVIGFTSGTIPEAKANLLLLKGSAAIGVFWGAFMARDPGANKENFQQLFEWYEEGLLRPHVSHQMPLESAADALIALKNREVIGKAVLTVGR